MTRGHGCMRGIVGLGVLCLAVGAGQGSGPVHAESANTRPTLDPSLGSRRPVSARAIELASKGRIAVHVYTEPRRALGPVIAREPSVSVVRSALVGGHAFHALETTVDGARRIASLPGVVWVEQAPEITPRNDTLRRIVQDGSVPEPGESVLGGPFDSAGLTGAGQIAGLIDDPLDWDHCAFDDSNAIGPAHRKIEAYNAPIGAVSAHGTHVAGTLAGDSDEHADLYGVARGARLVFSTIPAFDETTLLEQLELHAAQGARVHSNSWGDEQSSAYGGLARAIDAFSWQHDENLVVIAAANQTVLKTPENAKNALAVSASLDASFMDRFCVGPTGPTADGRRKPELVAPGCSIFSAYPFGGGCGTVFSSGTSMATPAVAGAALVARQYFTEGWYPAGEPTPANAFTPTGALLKAVLIAGAADLTQEPGWPGDREGWGRVMLAGSLPLGMSTPRRLIVEQRWNNQDDPTGEAIEQGEHQALRFRVEDASVPVRIVLSWHDAPGDFGAADPVVNDLDLVVLGPSGSAYMGNDLADGGSVPHAIVGGGDDSTGDGPRDTQNNTEVVALPIPAPGDYAVRIEGTGIAVGSQGFGLAIVGGVVPLVEAPCSTADQAPPFGTLDLADIGAFINAFSERLSAGDLNNDGLFDLADLGLFVGAFSAGCP